MSLISEFKSFAVKGNAIDLAVGVIIGAAFGKIVESLVGDVMRSETMTLQALDDIQDAAQAFERYDLVSAPVVDSNGRLVGRLTVATVVDAIRERSESETLAQRTLRQITESQRALFEDAVKQGDKLDEESFRVQLQRLSHSYERFLQDNPNHAEAYASYGYLLRKVDMRKQAAAMLLKSNQLDPNIPLVKNQIGNLLAEDGRPLLQAVVWVVPPE